MKKSVASRPAVTQPNAKEIKPAEVAPKTEVLIIPVDVEVKALVKEFAAASRITLQKAFAMVATEVAAADPVPWFIIKNGKKIEFDQVPDVFELLTGN
jgi:hypothetical protein